MKEAEEGVVRGCLPKGKVKVKEGLGLVRNGGSDVLSDEHPETWVFHSPRVACSFRHFTILQTGILRSERAKLIQSPLTPSHVATLLQSPAASCCLSILGICGSHGEGTWFGSGTRHREHRLPGIWEKAWGWSCKVWEGLD